MSLGELLRKRLYYSLSWRSPISFRFDWSFCPYKVKPRQRAFNLQLIGRPRWIGLGIDLKLDRPGGYHFGWLDDEGKDEIAITNTGNVEFGLAFLFWYFFFRWNRIKWEPKREWLARNPGQERNNVYHI